MRSMTLYYLGIPVKVEPYPEPEWVWATWPDGREFKHWTEQLKTTPWGSKSVGDLASEG